jgi:hypothetical protein
MTNAELQRRRRNQRLRIRRKQLYASLRARGLVSTKYRFGQPRLYAIHDEETRRNKTYYRIYNAKRFAQGLTCAGKPRKQHRHFLSRATTIEQRRANNTARASHYAKINIAKGLTGAGKPRKDFLAPTPFELEYRAFRESLNVSLPEFMTWNDRSDLDQVAA